MPRAEQGQAEGHGPPGEIRPAATGREAVRGPMRRSMSRSSTWLSALAPATGERAADDQRGQRHRRRRPPAAATIAHTAVSTSSDMIRGLVSVT